ncbi:MAG: hypothetical protein ACTSVY_09770 [Candidatus Helarchaeota archaeon]
MVLTTGIGSHPINDVQQVFQDLIESEISLLYFPQLKGENMLFNYHAIIPGLKLQLGKLIFNLNQFEIEKELDAFRNDLFMRKNLIKRRNFDVSIFNLKGLDNLEENLKNYSPKPMGLKGQITGPLSEAYSVRVEPVGKKAIDLPEFLDLFISTTSEIAFSIDSELNHLSHDLIGNSNFTTIFIDEPLLTIVLKELDQKTAFKYLSDVLNSISGRKGIHVCDDIVGISDFLLALPLDYISYDARFYPKTIEYLDDTKVSEYLERGGGFALGLTPNRPESLVGEENIEKLQRGELNIKEFIPTELTLLKDFEDILKDFNDKGIDSKLVVKNLLLTPQCGFQSFTLPNPERGEQIVRTLLTIQEKTARLIEKKYA